MENEKIKYSNLIDAYYNGNKIRVVYRNINNERKLVSGPIKYKLFSKNKLPGCKCIESEKKFVLDDNIPVYECICDRQGYYKYRNNSLENFVSPLQWFLFNNFEFKRQPNSKLNIVYFDIETTTKYGFPDYKNPKEEIFSISVYDNIENVMYLLFYHPNVENKIEKKFIDYKGIKTKVIYTNKETILLELFTKVLQKTKPDVITAWNISFDINYLVNRMRKLGMNINKLSYLGKVEIKEKKILGKNIIHKDKEQTIEIRGTQVFDLLNGYRFISFKELSSYRLDNVAEHILGEKKLKVDFDINKEYDNWTYENNFIEKYNLQDTYLIIKIDEKINITKYFFQLKNITKTANINDIFASGKLIENVMIDKYKDRYVFPNKYTNKIENPTLMGGYVVTPKSKLYKNVCVMDFSGFYPNIIKQFNLSKEKVQANLNFDTTKIDSFWIVENKQKLYEIIDDKKIKIKLPNDLSVNGEVVIDLKENGIVTNIINDFTQLRKEAKKKMNEFDYGTNEYNEWDKIQFSYKAIINAIYGVHSYKGFMLFDENIANLITFFGREINKFVAKSLVSEYGYEWVYGDTDSIFIVTKEQDLDKQIKEIKEIIEPFVNKKIREYLYLLLPKEIVDERLYLSMDIEKIYEKIMFTGVKKKYMGKLKWFKGKQTNKLHFVGIDLIKSNLPEIIKNSLQIFVDEWFNKENDIDLVLNKCYKLIKQENDISKFGVPMKLEKDVHLYPNLPVKRGVIWSNENLHKEYKQGMKFKGVYINKTNKINTDIICFDEDKDLQNWNIEINKKKYLRDFYEKINNLVRNNPGLVQVNKNKLEVISNNLNTLNNFF